LQKLAESDAPVTQKLSAAQAQKDELQKLTLDEKSFRMMLNDDPMATEKLAEGIRQFCVDAVKLEKIVEAMR
jgi:transaldolase